MENVNLTLLSSVIAAICGLITCSVILFKWIQWRYGVVVDFTYKIMPHDKDEYWLLITNKRTKAFSIQESYFVEGKQKKKYKMGLMSLPSHHLDRFAYRFPIEFHIENASHYLIKINGRRYQFDLKKVSSSDDLTSFQE